MPLRASAFRRVVFEGYTNTRGGGGEDTLSRKLQRLPLTRADRNLGGKPP